MSCYPNLLMCLCCITFFMKCIVGFTKENRTFYLSGYDTDANGNKLGSFNIEFDIAYMTHAETVNIACRVHGCLDEDLLAIAQHVSDTRSLMILTHMTITSIIS